MKLNSVIYFLLLLLNSTLVLAIKDVNFEHSNGLDLMHKYSAQYLDFEADEKLLLLKENYERLKPSKVPYNEKPIIPKVIHQIWLGYDPIPENFQYYLKTWLFNNPDWKVKIWSREDILKENFPNIDLFFLARSHAEQSDIIRYEIIYRYGGLYIDTDIECFANFDELHHKYDFYVNMEPPALNKKRVTIANNMIGAVPNHYILSRTLANIRSNWNVVEDDFESNFSNSWTSFRRSMHNLAVQRTMYPLSDAVLEFLVHEDQNKYKSIILPASYNIPMYFVNDRPIINFFSNTFRGRAKLSNKIDIQPETLSFHFYDKQNSLMHFVDFSEALFEKSKLKSIFYKLTKFRDKYYLAFRDLYNAKFPTEIGYDHSPMIPKIIYIDCEKLSEQKIYDLQQKWQSLNPDFNIQILDSNYLDKELGQLNFSNNKLVKIFNLLNLKGGVYVKSSFKPLKLREFNHKYSYYGIFSKLNKLFDNLKISTDIIAISQNHSISHNLLREIAIEQSENNSISEAKVKRIYRENAYKYHKLDGDSIILPEMVFNQKR